MTCGSGWMFLRAFNESECWCLLKGSARSFFKSPAVYFRRGTQKLGHTALACVEHGGTRNAVKHIILSYPTDPSPCNNQIFFRGYGSVDCDAVQLSRLEAFPPANPLESPLDRRAVRVREVLLLMLGDHCSLVRLQCKRCLCISW